MAIFIRKGGEGFTTDPADRRVRKGDTRKENV